MAERRMFAKSIIDSDAFLDMPLTTQSLYFHLGMRADDDGFLNNARKIQRTIGCSDDDLKILFAKNFVISMGDGICVIKHWKVHNLIQKDRYKPTNYLELKDKLSIKNNNVYTLDTECIQDVSGLEPQVRLGKVSLENTLVPSEAVDPCPHQEIINLYHEILPMMTRIKTWGEKRQTLLKTRWREDKKRQSIEYWQKLFSHVAKSDFLCGRSKSGFMADLEWILNASNFVKVIEGKYDNR